MTPVADPNGWAGWEQTLSMPDSLLEAFRPIDELADEGTHSVLISRSRRRKKAAVAVALMYSPGVVRSASRPESDGRRCAGLVESKRRRRANRIDKVHLEIARVECVMLRRGTLNRPRQHHGAQPVHDSVRDNRDALLQNGSSRVVAIVAAQSALDNTAGAALNRDRV